LLSLQGIACFSDWIGSRLWLCSSLCIGTNSGTGPCACVYPFFCFGLPGG
jgi:hypothetical protein